MKKMPNKELARRTGFTESHISRVLSGKTTPSVDCLTKIAVVLHTTVDDVLRCIISRGADVKKGCKWWNS